MCILGGWGVIPICSFSNWFSRLNEVLAKHNEVETPDVPEFHMEEGSQKFGDTKITKSIYNL